MTNSHGTSLIEEIEGESMEDRERRLVQAIEAIATTPPSIMKIFRKIIATVDVYPDFRQDFVGIDLKNTIRPKLLTASYIQQASPPRPHD